MTTKNAAPPEQRLTSPGKGRLLGVEDIQLLLPRDRGRLVSRQWVLTNVARDKRIAFGRSVAWWEQDFINWLAAMAGKVHKRRPRKVRATKRAA